VNRALLVLAIAACSEREHAKPQPHDPLRRRVIEPPTGNVVRALPPFAIQKDGVGPYKLGEPLEKVLEDLPSGPHIALFDIPGVVHRSLIRTEDDMVLIGGEPTSVASLVAVIGADVARTESGVHVGTTREEMLRLLGPASEEADRARDPRIVVPAAQRNLRAIMDGDVATALVLIADPGTPSAVAAACARPAAVDRASTGGATDHAFGACLDKGELVEVDGDDVGIRVADGDKPIATVRISGLVFAAALENLVDGRDELVVVSRTDDAQVRSWTLHVYRLVEGGRLVKAIEPVALYQLSSSNARWIGSDLRDLDLYLELVSRPDVIEVGGLLTTRTGAQGSRKIRDVVAISPVPVPRRRGKAGEAVDAGVEPVDGAVRPKP
jgi:hypothetical protein